MKIFSTIQNEISSYLDVEQEISPGVSFSESKLKRRIALYKNRHYPKGKFTKQGEYKYWPDIIAPLVDSNVKNLRFTTKNILPFSVNPIGDFAAVFTLNAGLDEWMWKNGRAEELNESIEAFSADGNVLFKKVKGGYSVCDPDNTYIINQAARSIDETPVIERVELTQSQLRAKAGVWKNVDEVIRDCGNKFFKKTIKGAQKDSTNPMYEVFERNWEISEAALFEAKGEKGGDENKFVLARVIVAGLSKNQSDKKYVLFAEELKGKLSDYFVEAHRGPYKGRFWREGLYELLFDHQYRACEIAQQIARGLDWASKVVFKSADTKTIQNIRTDVANGTIIKSQDLAQVDVRLQGLDQLIADWNRNLEDARRIANSPEVVEGASLPANTPFGLGQLIDVNASKLFVFLRQKLGIAYARVFKEFVLPELVRDLRAQDIIRVTGDASMLDRFKMLAVENWYARNLIAIGPHGPEVAASIKAQKLLELQDAEPLIKNVKETWEGVLPRIQVTITGENYDTAENLITIASVLQFETDPVRRAFLLDTIYAAKGIPVPPAVQQQMEQGQGGGPKDTSKFAEAVGQPEKVPA